MWLYAQVILHACIPNTRLHICKETCIHAYVTRVFPHVCGGELQGHKFTCV